MKKEFNLDKQDCQTLTEILWYYENAMKLSPNGYSINHKAILQFKQNNDITFVKMKDAVPTSGNYFQFSSGSSKCVSLIKGIRNSFAHGQVVRDGRYLVFEHIYRSVLKMRGRIRRDLLKGLFEAIKASKTA